MLPHCDDELQIAADMLCCSLRSLVVVEEIDDNGRGCVDVTVSSVVKVERLRLSGGRRRWEAESQLSCVNIMSVARIQAGRGRLASMWDEIGDLQLTLLSTSLRTRQRKVA